MKTYRIREPRCWVLRCVCNGCKHYGAQYIVRQDGPFCVEATADPKGAKVFCSAAAAARFCRKASTVMPYRVFRRGKAAR